MNNVDLLFHKIDEGRAGKNVGLETGIPKLDQITGGVQKGVYTLIFGLSGSGKSSLALYCYIYRPLKDHPEKDLKYIYFSLEMSAEILLAKLLCLWIYDEFKVIIPYSSVMSWRTPLPDEYYKYLIAGRDWLNSICDKLIIIDTSLTSKVFYSKIMTYLEQWGTFEESEDGRRKIYVKKNPAQFVGVVVDHISLCNPLPGNTKKQEIDLISQYCVGLRERCGVSFYILQQENRNSASAEKIKLDMTDCSLDGLKDSGNPSNDSELCIGVYCPLKFKVKTKGGYPIVTEDNGNGFTGFRDRIRFLQIIKNRYGESDRAIPVAFFGENGYFKQLPKYEEMLNPILYTNLLSFPNPEEEDKKESEDSGSKKEIIFKF